MLVVCLDFLLVSVSCLLLRSSTGLSSSASVTCSRVTSNSSADYISFLVPGNQEICKEEFVINSVTQFVNESKTRLLSKVFSWERLWIKLLALKDFGLVGLE